MRGRRRETTPRRRGMPRVAEQKESGFALFCGWLEKRGDNGNSSQSELPARREKPEELRTAKVPGGTAGRRARFLIGWPTPRWACSLRADWWREGGFRGHVANRGFPSRLEAGRRRKWREGVYKVPSHWAAASELGRGGQGSRRRGRGGCGSPRRRPMGARRRAIARPSCGGIGLGWSPDGTPVPCRPGSPKRCGRQGAGPSPGARRGAACRVRPSLALRACS